MSEAERLRRALRDQAGIDLASLVPADGGESGSAFLATDPAGRSSVLKLSRYREFGALADVVDRLRGRGYPAARLHVSGQVDGQAFWLQERLPGTVLAENTVLARLGQLLPELLRLNDAQAGLGDGAHRLADLLVTTLTEGGDGYCVHATLEARTGTRELLATLRRTADRCLDAIPERNDYVHYDFTVANLLTDGALRVYLAHMVLRQVDWSLRHHPGAPATRHHLRLAGLVEADL